MPPTPAATTAARFQRLTLTPAEAAALQAPAPGRSAGPERPGGRDAALDMIRGLAVLLAVLNHLPTTSVYQWWTVERLGPVTGAELLVLVSGLVLGGVHRARIAAQGWHASAVGLWRRSLQLYRVAVAVVLVLWAAGLLGVRSAALTTWTDAGGAVHQMVPAPGLAALWDVVRLRVAPWQCNVLGLYVAFTALAPLALWLLARRRWPLLLAASWAAYALNAWLHLRPTGAAFESPFPLLTWQLPFVHALAAGYHREALAAALPRAWRRRLVLAAAALAGAAALFAWHNPWNGAPAWTRPALVSPERFTAAYRVLAGERTWLGPGRLIDAALVVLVLHAALTRWRRGAERAVGWLLVPVGRASLYVFVAHLAAVAVVGWLPAPPHGALAVNTAVHTAALLALWWCVRARVLFAVIPR